MLLLREGQATMEDAYQQWELLIRESSKAVGSYEYLNYIDDCIAVKMFREERNTVRAILAALMINAPDDELIAYLRERGFIIDTSGETAYVQSIAKAYQRVKMFDNRIKSKMKKIEAVAKRTGQKQDETTYDEHVARLVMKLGVQIDESTLTVGRYNQYRKLIEKQKEHGGNKAK